MTRPPLAPGPSPPVDAARRSRQRAQRLVDAPVAAPAEIVRALFGVQAQDRAAAFLALRARGAASAEAVESALSGDRSIVRTWAMRGTLHLLAAEDLPTALAVFGPVFIARDARRMADLGLPPELAERSTQEAVAVLAEHGPLTRHELAHHLRARGIPVAVEGQAAIHVVGRAALAGVLVECGTRGRDILYAPLDPRSLPDRDAALAELARRHLAAHAPASMADFAAWTGLPAAGVRRGWEAAHGPAAGTFGGPPASPSEPLPPGPVRLLPAFDEWLLGWASREGVVAAAHARAVAPGGGIIRPVAVADGRVVATWRLDRRRRRVVVEPLGRLRREVRAGLRGESSAVGDFLGVALRCEVGPARASAP